MAEQVQIRLQENLLKFIDKLVKKKEFKSRSDAIRAMIEFYLERRKTMEFLKILLKREKEAIEHPEALIPLDEL